jgi:hypothetical protein
MNRQRYFDKNVWITKTHTYTPQRPKSLDGPKNISVLIFFHPFED